MSRILNPPDSIERPDDVIPRCAPCGNPGFAASGHDPGLDACHAALAREQAALLRRWETADYVRSHPWATLREIERAVRERYAC